jgi:cell wall-associated NlpC family hydrolase
VIGTALLALVLVTSPATADPTDPPPSREDVRDARQQAERAADDVDSIQEQIDPANANLEAASIAAQQAAEAYNGARYRLQQARLAERQAARESRRAARALAVVKADYRDAVLTSFVAKPELNALGAMLQADGLPSLLDRSATAGIVQGEFEEQRAEYEDAVDDAEDAEDAAEQAAADAEDAAATALTARQEAEAAVAAAATAAETASAEKTRLVRRMARLQGISVALAEERQAAIEQERREQAAQEQQEQAEQQAEQQEQAEPQEPQEPQQPEPPAEDTDDDAPSRPPADDRTEDPAEDAPPADQGGASAAIAFARAQIGEPYVWAAAGPSAWDCSGLTMAAWAAAGKSLPHYSVAQYEQSTPISASDLRPGDLVFWGSSSSAGSIYHVALYAGDGNIIHAPRTGRPVTEESMYYWIPPTHYARP